MNFQKKNIVNKRNDESAPAPILYKKTGQSNLDTKKKRQAKNVANESATNSESTDSKNGTAPTTVRPHVPNYICCIWSVHNCLFPTEIRTKTEKGPSRFK